LALGTAQFGLDYGVANKGGQIEPDMAAAIISRAWAVGMDTVDTAIGYGQSEQRLGEIGVHSWRIVSKLPEYPRDCPNIIEWVNSSVEGSLARLGVGRLHGLLLHRPQQLLGHGGHELYRAMVRIKDSGKVGKIGISIYSPDELDMIWPHFQFDLVQSPFNVFDRRLATTGWLQKLNREGVEVHVRSVFLQGLLLAGNDGVPVGFQRWSSLWAAWHSWLRDVSCSPIQAALGHVLAFPEISRVIVGVDSLEQLDEILRGASLRQGVAPQVLMSEDLDLINPTRWSAFL
jgi:aryl-alcohol dehydrogenase-like predicted oxidoreductase